MNNSKNCGENEIKLFKYITFISLKFIKELQQFILYHK